MNISNQLKACYEKAQAATTLPVFFRNLLNFFKILDSSANILKFLLNEIKKNSHLIKHKDFTKRNLAPGYHHTKLMWYYKVAITDKEFLIKNFPSEAENIKKIHENLEIIFDPKSRFHPNADPRLPELKSSLEITWKTIQEYCLSHKNTEQVTSEYFDGVKIIPTINPDNINIPNNIIMTHDLIKRINQDNKQTIRFKIFDDKKGILTLSSYKITFPKKTGITRVLIKFTTQNKKTYSYDELDDKIEGRERSLSKKLQKNRNRKFFDAFKHINNAISKQTDGKINDFYKFTINDVQVNPNYL